MSVLAMMSMAMESIGDFTELKVSVEGEDLYVLKHFLPENFSKNNDLIKLTTEPTIENPGYYSLSSKTFMKLFIVLSKHYNSKTTFLFQKRDDGDFYLFIKNLSPLPEETKYPEETRTYYNDPYGKNRIPPKIL